MDGRDANEDVSVTQVMIWQRSMQDATGRYAIERRNMHFCAYVEFESLLPLPT